MKTTGVRGSVMPFMIPRAAGLESTGCQTLRVTIAPDVLAATRRALHGVAELVLAGPQYRGQGTIRLRARPGGFGTVTQPDLRVVGDELVAGEVRLALRGTTCAALGRAAGVPAGAPAGLYHDGSGVGLDEPVHVDRAAAAVLADCFTRGDEALRALLPEQEPVLWPEHFDLGASAGEVNYGVSPGDGYLPEPYAYVGPWHPRTGSFWNAPFGAARPLRDLAGPDGLRAFFAAGRDLAAAG
jgi:hypothetical protein